MSKKKRAEGGVPSGLDPAEGGRARAEKLTPEEREEIARRAAEARWGNDLPVATHGSPDHPLRIANLEIPCYVLSDGRRVLHQRGMVSALGMSRGSSGSTGGDRLAKFVAGDRLKPFIANHLITVTETPIRFKTSVGQLAYGYEATVLADICDAVLAARQAGVLQQQQMHIAEQCEILVRGFARVGIIALVDEATGYQDVRARDALAKILEAYIAKELRKWVQTFSPDFYKEMFRLRSIPYNGTVRRPQYIGHLTNDLVYSRLAPGVLKELQNKNPTTESGRRRSKHHQWLTEDHGHPELKAHLKTIIALMENSETWEQFYKMLERSLPKHVELPLFDWSDSSEGVTTGSAADESESDKEHVDR